MNIPTPLMPRFRGIAWSKLVRVGALLAGILAVVPLLASPAQSGSLPKPSPRALDAVPTTKLLAIGNFTKHATLKQWKPLVSSEMRATARLYLTGRIDQWYVKQDQTGVVFLINATDPKEAQGLLSKLPLARAGLMTFQIIPLGPLSPMQALLSQPAK